MSEHEHETEIRCTTCGTSVQDMDFLVDHITDCHDILDVLVNGISEHCEVVTNA